MGEMCCALSTKDTPDGEVATEGETEANPNLDPDPNPNPYPNPKRCT